MKQYQGVYIGPNTLHKGLRVTVLEQWDSAGMPMARVQLGGGPITVIPLAEIRPLGIDERPAYIPAPEDDFAPISGSDWLKPEDDFAPVQAEFEVKDLKIGVEGGWAFRIPKAMVSTIANQQPTNKKELTMQENVERRARNLAALIQDDYTTAQAVFADHDKQYTYKVPKAWEVAEGDSLIVDSPHNGLTVVRVVSVDEVSRVDADAAFTYKWAVQKVDRTEHDERNAREAEFAKRMVEVERIRRRDLALADAKAALGKTTKAAREFDRAVRDLKGLK